MDILNPILDSEPMKFEHTHTVTGLFQQVCGKKSLKCEDLTDEHSYTPTILWQACSVESIFNPIETREESIRVWV